MSNVSVTPIGSCRITNPLRCDLARRRISLNLTGVYGYVHSSAEALQLTKFIQGDLVPPEHLQPFLFPANDLSNLLSKKHQQSDLYLVEISTARSIQVAGYCIQANYLNRHFRSFFADTTRTRKYWRQVDKGDREGLKSFLESDPEFQEYGDQDQNMLQNITRQTISPGELNSNLRELTDRLPRVIFVSHCNARNINGELLQTRHQIVELLKDATSELHLDFYNPSDLSTTLGQNKTFLDLDSSLTHYSPFFEQRMFEELDERFIRTLKQEIGIDLDRSDVEEALEISIERIEQLLSNSELHIAANMINSDLKRFPESARLQHLNLTLCSDRNDFRQARIAFDSLSKLGAASEIDLQELYKFAFKGGHWKDVLELEELIDKEESHSVDTLKHAATAAKQLNQYEVAIAYWQSAAASSFEDSDIAVEIAKCANKLGNDRLLGEWSHKALEWGSHSSDPLQLLGRLAIREHNSSDLETILVRLFMQDQTEALKIMELADQNSMHVAVANSLLAVNGFNNANLNFGIATERLVSDWIKVARRHINKSEDLSAMEVLRAALIIGRTIPLPIDCYDRFGLQGGTQFAQVLEMGITRTSPRSQWTATTYCPSWTQI